MILLINACVRNGSRTKRLADHLIGKLNGPVEEVRVGELTFPKADQAFLEQRDALIRNGSFTHPMFDLARQFAEADTVVITAPFWDLSFPAALKQYFEQINVVGVTFSYSPEGIPIGMCKAKILYYVTTAGGSILSADYGYGYIQALARGFYQIPETVLIRAEGLDIQGADTEAILRRAESSIDLLFAEEQEESGR